MSAKVILITGASRGIGAAIARSAAHAGYNLGINYHRNESAASRLADEVRQIGVKAMTIRADVSREEEVGSMFAQLDRELGVLAVLINNAGVIDRQMRCDQMSAERLQRIFSINVIGAFLCAREAIKRMSVRYGGVGGNIVNISSRASVLGSPHEYIDYAASKGALDTMTLGLAKEVANEGIRVNAVRPGIIATDIHASGGDPDRVDRLAPHIPMQRGGTPEEVASATMWLISDQASFTTGSFIEVSGGR